MNSTMMQLSEQNAFAPGGLDEACAAAFRQGAQDERARFTAVQRSEHIAGRDAAAHQLLFNTDLDADAIISVLQTLPKARPAAAAALDRAANAPGGLVVDAVSSNMAEGSGWGATIAKTNDRVDVEAFPHGVQHGVQHPRSA